MATVDIKYSQGVVDNLRISPLNSALFGGSIGAMLDSLLGAAHALGTAYPDFDSYRQTASSLQLDYADGAYQTYSGLRFDVPGAVSTGATATQATFHKEGLLSMQEAGTLNYDYVSTASALSIDAAAKGSLVTSLSMAMLLPPTHPAYRPVTGNPGVKIDGSMFVDGNYDMSGTISRVSTTADQFFQSGVITGDFEVSTNTLASGQGKSQSSVSGILHDVSEDYRDGSHARMSDLDTRIGPSEKVGIGLLANPAHFSGPDTIRIDLPAKLYAPLGLASGDGDDRISLAGGGGMLNVDAGDGNDVIGIVSAAHAIDGGKGLDQVTLAGKRSGFMVQRVEDGYKLTDGAAAASTLKSVERLAFTDAHVALDIEGHGGQAYRLYQAAFDRAPDLAGVGFHMWRLETVGLSLTQVAEGFIESPEFDARYGTLSNHDFVVQLYANVLHRAPDPAGLEYHVDLLDSGRITRAMDLVHFSESPENQAALIGVIGNGFEFIPYI